MWRRAVLWYLFIICGHTSSQPITNDSENARQARQLDFGECCPCPKPGQGELSNVGGLYRSRDLGPVGRAQDLDDCPCRARHADSDGASSILFPTAMRPNGAVVRPDERKEDLKPLLHPEVDLASSVLNTLREATDEEYQDALARDAARSMAKAAEESIFGDTTPEASNNNIVTIVLTPKQTDSDDDVIPQESRIQESRCIHSPLASRRTNLGRMRVTPQSPNLLHDIFGLPRMSKSADLRHKNLLDMDSSVDASNIKERVVPLEKDHIKNGEISGPKTYNVPSLKLNSNIERESSNINTYSDNDCDVNKEPNIQLSLIQNKLHDFLSSRSLLPKLRLDTLKTRASDNNMEELTLSPSNIQEQVKKMPYFETKSHLPNILPKSRPVLKNLLKLKDVELIPLKDLLKKGTQQAKINKPKLGVPSIINNESDESEASDMLKTLPRHKAVAVDDPEVSPSNNIEQISDDNCEISTKIPHSQTSIDELTDQIFDKKPSSQQIKSVVEEESTHFGNSQSDELTDGIDDCDTETLPVTEIGIPFSSERPVKDEIQDAKQADIDTSMGRDLSQDDMKEMQDQKSGLIKDDCMENNNDADSITDSSNTNDRVYQEDLDKGDSVEALPNETLLPEESCEHNIEANNDIKPLDSNFTPKIINPLSIDKTLFSIKENIIKKLESLNPKKSNIFNQKSINDESQEADCKNDESIQMTTILPHVSNDSFENAGESSSDISMQDLQKMSDAMLKNYTDKERVLNKMECNIPSQEITDPIVSPEPISTDIKGSDESLEESANLQNNVERNPNNSLETTCQSDLILPEQSIARPTDVNSEASNIAINRIPPNQNSNGLPISSSDVVQPCENNLFMKMSPIPTLDKLKSRLNHLFVKEDRKAEDLPLSNADSIIDMNQMNLNILDPVMATDASTTNLQSKLPPVRFFEDLDILQLAPLSVMPRAKLPSPKDFSLKPINLKSPLNNKEKRRKQEEGIFSLPTSRNNMRPNKLNLKSSKGSNSPSNSISNIITPFKHDNLLNSQSLNDLSENINTHVKSASRNMQNALESRFKEVTKTSPTKLQSHDLLDVLSRNHEDVNDKLRALHMDLNDRIDTMRNDLIDKSRLLTSESRNRKPGLLLLSSQNTGKQSTLRNSQPNLQLSRKEPKRTPTSRGHTEKKKYGMGSLQTTRHDMFKMPTAASVPVPKTVKVPELIMSSTNAPGFVIQRASDKPKIKIIETSQSKPDVNILWNKASKTINNSNTPVRKPNKPLRDSKIKVSFSTTHRPAMASKKLSTRLQNTEKGNNQEIFGQSVSSEHQAGTRSESRQPKMYPPISSLLNPQKLDNTGAENLGWLNVKDSASFIATPLRTFDTNETLQTAKPRNTNSLQSWPNASEGSFLTKVREAVEARLSTANSSNAIKQSKVLPYIENQYIPEAKVGSSVDMTRSASENIDIIDGQTLKENVTYKCKMVCTKE